MICPIDASHTEAEKEQLRRKYNADGTPKHDINWDDPMTQAYGYPESYR